MPKRLCVRDVLRSVPFPLLRSEWRALVLLAVVGGLLTPGVFNWMVERTARRFQPLGAPPLPRVRGATLLVGLAVTAAGWLVQGGAGGILPQLFYSCRDKSGAWNLSNLDLPVHALARPDPLQKLILQHLRSASDKRCLERFE